MQPVTPPPSDPALLNPTNVAGRRIVGFLIDAALGTLILFGYAAATFTNTQFDSTFTAEVQCDVINELTNDICVQVNETVYVGSGGDGAVMVLLWFLWVLLTTIVLPSITGWSPGKLVTGVRVVDKDSFTKAGVGANIIRAIMWVVDAFPYFGPLVGGITMLATSDRRRVGDLAAGTLVIRAESVGRPPVQVPAPFSAPPPGAFTPPPPTNPIPAAGPPPPTGTPYNAPPPTGPPPSYQPPAPVDSPSPPAGAPPVFPPPSSPPEPEPEPTIESPVIGATDQIPVVAPEPTTDLPVIDPQPVFDETPIAEPEIIDDPATIDAPIEAATTAPVPPADQPPAEPPTDAPQRPGVDAPMWDDVRDTYIQWDPELLEWMEWSEAQGAWIPISQ